MISQSVHVVAAVIYNRNKEKVLIAKRSDDKHQGGKWEFPGGKVEAGESAKQALQRELFEELGITISNGQPLIQIRHQYPEKSVFLDVFEVIANGSAIGKEGQEIAWVDKNKLSTFTFPAANLPILRAVDLPEICLVAPEPKDAVQFLESIDQVLQKGVSLILFKAKKLAPQAYLSLADQVIECAHQYHAKVVLNSPSEMMDKADGLYLSSSQLMALNKRPKLTNQQMLSVSCHTEKELNYAAKLKADFVFLSPVKKTKAHPKLGGMGWEHFQQVVADINCPVYAFGGMNENDVTDARRSGGQGIASMTGLWE